MPPPGDGSPPSYPVPPSYPTTAAPQVVMSSPGPAPGVVYAGFGARFLGYLIDIVLLLAVEMIALIPLVIIPIVQFYTAHPIVSGQPLPVLTADLNGRVLLAGLLGTVLSALYFGGMVAWQGRTLGQRAMGAEVVRAEDGGRLPVGRALVRASIFWAPSLLGIVQYLGTAAQLLALIGMIAVAWDPRKQGWHDKLGRSLVIKRVGVGGRL